MPSLRTPLSYRENYLRSVEFRDPEYIPCRVLITWPVWNIYREKLENIALQHPLVFPEFKPGSIHYGAERGVLRTKRALTDPFGCVWNFNIEGYQGQVIRHPLEDWSLFKDYSFPDPDSGLPAEGSDKITPWSTVYESLDRMKNEGSLIHISLMHGFFFQRLYYLRGFINLMRDFIHKPPQIYDLVEKLTEYILSLVKNLLKWGRIDVIYFGDDLGTQTRMPISPAVFKEFIYPSYRKIFQRVRESGAHVYLHSDGHVVEVLDQLIDAGASILNIQDKVNGIENIKSICKGRKCVDVDIDRQSLVPFGSPEEIKSHIKHVIDELAMRKGGLMIESEVHPPTPLRNIEAVIEAMEQYMWL
jgi:hypothetical protein